MGRRANPMAIKAALTYEINEIAALLGKSPATIRNWINDGLPVLSQKKPFLISGAALRDFLRAKMQKSKSPLAPNELFCLSCRAGRKPLGMAVEAITNTPKTTRLKGACEQCGASACRMISNTKAADFARTFRFEGNGNSEA